MSEAGPIDAVVFVALPAVASISAFFAIYFFLVQYVTTGTLGRHLAGLKTRAGQQQQQRQQQQHCHSHAHGHGHHEHTNCGCPELSERAKNIVAEDLAQHRAGYSSPAGNGDTLRNKAHLRRSVRKRTRNPLVFNSPFRTY